MKQMIIVAVNEEKVEVTISYDTNTHTIIVQIPPTDVTKEIVIQKESRIIK